MIVIGLNSAVTPPGRELRPDALDGLAQLAAGRALRPARRRRRHAGHRQREPARARPGRQGSRAGESACPTSSSRPPTASRSAVWRASVYERHYAGLDSLVRGSSVALLGRFLNARRGPVHGELLSYLFLAKEFLEELIALGRRDAERWLETSHDAVCGRSGACERSSQRHGRGLGERRPGGALRAAAAPGGDRHRRPAAAHPGRQGRQPGGRRRAAGCADAVRRARRHGRPGAALAAARGGRHRAASCATRGRAGRR